MHIPVSYAFRSLWSARHNDGTTKRVGFDDNWFIQWAHDLATPFAAAIDTSTKVLN